MRRCAKFSVRHNIKLNARYGLNNKGNIMSNITTYQVDILRSGQPRAYADTEREYLITVKKEQFDKEGLFPYLLHGDVETRIKKDEAMREAGTMRGGQSPEGLRNGQREWAKKLVRSLCQNFREKDDDDGRTDMDAYFYPTLKSLKLDHVEGTITAFIIEPYAD